MTTSGFGAASYTPMLDAMTGEAADEVARGVARLRRAVVARVERPAQLPLYIYVTVRQLYRTYLTLAWEVSHLGELDLDHPSVLDRLSRNQLVQRVHRTSGDFALIARVCAALHPYAGSDARVADVEAVLRSWGDREAHLFRVLVPLANYAEKLKTEVTELLGVMGPGPLGPARGRIQEAQRALQPVAAHLSRATKLLHEFAEELKPLSAAGPFDMVPTTHHEKPAHQELDRRAAANPKRCAKEVTT